MNIYKHKTGSRAVAFLLSVFLLCSMLPISSLAANTEDKVDRLIAAFDTLDVSFSKAADGVYEQTVALRTPLDRLGLPDTLTVCLLSEQLDEDNKPEAPKPEDSAPEAPKPENPAPEAPKPENPAPEAPKPENPAPEAPKPENPAPETPKPENPAPETPKPEVTTPDAPKVDGAPTTEGEKLPSPEINEVQKISLFAQAGNLLQTFQSEKISVRWEATPSYDGEAGTYLFQPVLPAGYQVADNVTLPEVRIIVEDTPCTCIITCTSNDVADCARCANDFTKCKSIFNPFDLNPMTFLTGKPLSKKFRSGPVVADKADFDVFISADPNHDPDADVMSGKIQGYLNQLIQNGGGGKTSRFQTEATKVVIDTTDLTKWYLFDHYDNQHFTSDNGTTFDKAEWEKWIKTREDTKGTLPAHWYPYGLQNNEGHDGNAPAGSAPTNIEELYGTPENPGPNWGNTAYLREHIATAIETVNGASLPAMQFYGYFAGLFADFLFYPADKASTKKVTFDVDANNVLPHSLRYAGFLINTSIENKGTSGATISGYALVLEYGPINQDATVAVNSITGGYLYRLENVNVDDLHAKGIHDGSASVGTLLSGVSAENPESIYDRLLLEQYGNDFWKKSQINLEITSTHLTATISKLDTAGKLTGESTKILDNYKLSKEMPGGGFGPYVDYSVSTQQHTCNITSAYRFSNLKMSFENTGAGGTDSVLSGLAQSDYLNDSGKRFFINLTDPNKSDYTETANQVDLGYLKKMQDENIVLLTDESQTGGKDIFPKTHLGENSKDANNPYDVTDANIQDIYSGTDKTEKLAAKLAWLIYHTNKGNTGDPAIPTETAVPTLKLMDQADWGTPGSTSKQVSTVQREIIPGAAGSKQLKVFLNNDYTVNGLAERAMYSIKLPDNTIKTIADGGDIELKTDTDSGKLYFYVTDQWATGEYAVSLTYNTNPNYELGADPDKKIIKQSQTATTKFTVATDTVKPTVGTPTVGATADNKITATIQVTNTASTGAYTYTSDLAKYAVVVNGTATAPDVSTVTPINITADAPLPSSYTNTTASAPGDYYVHVYVWDAAGNYHVASSAKYTVTTIKGTATAVLHLMDKSGPDNTEITEVKKELIPEDASNKKQMKVYLNGDGSTNGLAGKEVYTIKFPGGTDEKTIKVGGDIELQEDAGKHFFYVENSDAWPAGEYTVSLNYDTNPPYTVNGLEIDSSTPDSTTFTILADKLAPTVTAPTGLNLTADGNITATLGTVTNTAGSDPKSDYASDLTKYAVVLSTDPTPAAANTIPDADKTDVANQTTNPWTSATFTSDAITAAGTYYVHVYVWDKAGNVGTATSTPYTVTAETATAKLSLENKSNWDSTSNLTEVQRELASNPVKVFLNGEGHTNGLAGKEAYTITVPGVVTPKTIKATGGDIDLKTEGGKPYFEVNPTDKTNWPNGSYTVTMTYTTPYGIGGANSGTLVTSCTPANDTFSIKTDNVAPTANKPTLTWSPDSSSFSVDIGATNTPSTDPDTYTSPLAKYLLVVNTEVNAVADPSSLVDSATTITNDTLPSPATVPIGTAGTYYAHLYVWDAAGNVGKDSSAGYTVNLTKKPQTLADGCGNPVTPHEHVLELGKDTSWTLPVSNTTVFDDTTNDVAPDPKVTFALGDATGTLTLTNGTVSPTKLGTTTVIATAAATTTHSAATLTLTIKVVDPLKVKLENANTGTDQFTVTPTKAEGKYPADDGSKKLQYREVGSADWTDVPGWNWNAPIDIPFAGLKPNTQYEVQLTAQDTRPGTPTSASDTTTFTTPPAANQGKIEVDVNDVPKDKPIFVTIERGGTVLDSKSGIGPDPSGNLHFTFDNLPDGIYNIVIKDENGNTRIEKVELKNGNPGNVNVSYEDLAKKETELILDLAGTAAPPKLVVGGLNEQYDNVTNTDDKKGVTVDDMNIIDPPGVPQKGSVKIELKVKGVAESDPNQLHKRDINLIKEKTPGQKFALITDLTLWKTITPPALPSRDPVQLNESNQLITVYIPMPKFEGTDMRVHRVHDDTTGGKVFATSFPQGASNATPDGEYYTIEGDWIVLHSKLFSLYAITYTPKSTGNNTGGGGGGGGGGGNTTPSNPDYAVKPEKDPSNGSVNSNKDTAKAGDTVTITTKPDNGFVLDDLVVIDKYGNKVPVKDNGNGTYTFTMPKSDVTVKPIYRERLSPLEKTGVDRLLNTDDHILYLIGDNFGQFRPNANMTRAEVAQMFFRLLRDQNVAITKSFSDVPGDAWYSHAVQTMASLGIVEGYQGNFRPNAPVTRAEFTAIAMRFANANDGKANFSDVPASHWAYGAIGQACAYGWINGMPDGTFRPDEQITRAQVTRIVNGMLLRIADEAYIKAQLSTLLIFPDAADQQYWAWLDIVEATNAHDFTRDGRETWTGVRK